MTAYLESTYNRRAAGLVSEYSRLSSEIHRLTAIIRDGVLCCETGHLGAAYQHTFDDDGEFYHVNHDGDIFKYLKYECGCENCLAAFLASEERKRVRRQLGVIKAQMSKHAVVSSVDIEAAKGFAKSVHSTQVRRYTGEPYFNHLEEVASIVRGAGGDPEEIAASYLHDTLEDTNTPERTIRTKFGNRVAILVVCLSDLAKPSVGNRAYRKAMYRQKIFESPASAKLIKTADLISNTPSIRDNDPGFWPVYQAEAIELLDAIYFPDRRHIVLHNRLAQLLK